ncbi:MAG: TerD family protein [Fusobacteriaceae bacterium]
MDFSRLQNAGAHASTLNFSKAQAVQTGQRMNFSKENPTCKQVRVELYWTGENDGDASIVLLGADKKALKGLVDPTNANSTRGMVWYNNLSVKGVAHSGDARTSDNDPSTPEETINVTLDQLEADVDSLVIVASTYPNPAAPTKAVPFGKFRDCKVMVINNETNEVIYVYELDEDFSTHSSVELASFYKRNGEWMFTSMGEGVGTSPEALSDIATKYGLC